MEVAFLSAAAMVQRSLCPRTLGWGRFTRVDASLKVGCTYHVNSVSEHFNNPLNGLRVVDGVSDENIARQAIV
jgi:hypothetical protein